ncbi:M56 family metallopeptidase [Marinicella meishanensis]|uniref:M56 family metallopeptidase n=1 Tax=Marinicella meishanensis TaxID=2873263 RepID=UPI001CC0A213|nr:M56 family metallopeptidase [Marinicella sp. NBU2979]
MMDSLAFLLNPWWQLLLKMILLCGLLRWLSGLRLTAGSQAWVWRIGFLVLLLLPWLHQSLALLPIPLWSAELTLVGTVDQPTASSAMRVVAAANEAWSAGWLLGFIWAAVAGLLLLQLGRQLRHWQRLTQSAREVDDAVTLALVNGCMQQLTLSRQPRIKTHPELHSPCTWGLLRPVILIPESMRQQDALRVVLLHEMAHIKRGDWGWLMTAQVVTACCWFNPLMWWIKARMINSFETACDDLVLQQNIKPSVYAETLMGFHPQTAASLTLVTAMMAQPSVLYQRLHLILNPQLRSQSMPQKTHHLLLASATVATALMAVSQFTTAHEVPATPAAIHELSPSEPLVTQLHPEPATPPTRPHLVTEPVLHPTAPPRPEVARFPATDGRLPTPPKPHVDAYVAGVTAAVPPALPVLHANAAHRSAPVMAGQVAEKINSQARMLRIEAEKHRQSQQAKAAELRQHQHLSKAALKRQLADLERQKQRLIAEQKRREAELLALVQREQQQSHAELQRLQHAQEKLQREAKEAANDQR